MRHLLKAAVTALGLAGLGTAHAGACPPLLQHSFARLQDEKPQDLCQYAGQVIVVVNRASRCRTARGPGAGAAPGWNFHKYLIARDGSQVLSHSSDVDPLDPRFLGNVERLLAAKPPQTKS